MLKDERLFELSKKYNVARFMSIAPDTHVRYHVVAPNFNIRGMDYFKRPLKMFYDLLDVETFNPPSLNIRTFKETHEQGCPFIYGLTDLKEIETKVQELISQGYYCIISETINVNDGGLSGCIYQNGILNISPGLTPRGIETDEEPVASFNTDSDILTYLEAKHNFKFIDFKFEDHKRYEFSIHPNNVGYHNVNYIIWEVNDLNCNDSFEQIQRWPSKLSKHIGDKLYGLLVAQDYDIPTLRTDIFNVCHDQFIPILNINEFQLSNLNDKIIVRPCPHEQQPGQFNSVIIPWYDVMLYGLQTSIYKYISDELKDQLITGNIDTFIVQPYMDAIYSGAYLTTTTKEIHIEGVYGNGDDFMVNKRQPEELPDNVLNMISALGKNINKKLKASTRGEWIIISEKGRLVPYIVQLHCDSGVTNLNNERVYIYNTDELIFMYHKWSPHEGLDKLRQLIEMIERHRHKELINNDLTYPSIISSHAFGIEVVGFIGLTTHAADLLRKHKINSIMYV